MELFLTVVDYSAAASENLNNVVAGKTTAGATSVFAGGSTKLFKLDQGDLSLDNVSKSGNYSTATDQRWKLTQFGSVIIAANGQAKLQGYNLNSSTLLCRLSSRCSYSKICNCSSRLCCFWMAINLSKSSAMVSPR